MSENLPALRGLPEDQFIQEANRKEGFTRDESIIPFTRILQPLSPQINSTPGAEPGAFMNIATNTINKELVVIPIFHVWNFTEWTPRDQGGGFIRDWGEDMQGWQSKCDFDQQHAYIPETKDGHIISKQRHFFIFVMNEDGSYERSIMPFAGTSLKVARQWSSMMENAPKVETSKGLMTPAYFYYTYKITVTENRNTKGRWFLPMIRFNDNKRIIDYPNGEQLWKDAIAFRDSYRAGEVKIAEQADENGDNF